MELVSPLGSGNPPAYFVPEIAYDVQKLQQQLEEISRLNLYKSASFQQEEELARKDLEAKITRLECRKTLIENCMRQGEFANKRSFTELCMEKVTNPHYNTLKCSVKTAENCLTKMQGNLANPAIKKINRRLVVLKPKLQLHRELQAGKMATEELCKKMMANATASDKAQAALWVASVLGLSDSNETAPGDKTQALVGPAIPAENLSRPEQRALDAAAGDGALKLSAERSFVIGGQHSRNKRIAAALLAIFLFGMAYASYCRRPFLSNSGNKIVNSLLL